MQLCFMSGMTTEQWAAWVQAIGSVVAIAVAVLVARHHANKTDELQLQARNQRYEDMFGPTLGLLISVKEIFEDEVKERDRVVAEGNFYTPEDGFFLTFETLSNAFNEIPAHQLPSATAVQAVMRAKATLRISKESHMHGSFNLRDFFNGTDEYFKFYKSMVDELMNEVEILKQDLARLTNPPKKTKLNSHE